MRRHAIDSIAGTVNGVTSPHFTYDLNGNMTAGAGRSVSYWAFNMTQSVTQGDNQEEYVYDPEHARVELYDYQGESANVLYYLNDPTSGAMSEISWVDYTWHDYLKVDGKLIAERFCPVGTTCSSTTAWRYFVTDSLGSVATVTDSTATPDAPHTERDAYDPWGKKRSPITGADDNSCYSASISTRGYTGHEHMNGVCLINENARVYDPLLGRFMAPDDVITDIYDGQGLNRYTYVDNRPMTLTDPTGHDPQIAFTLKQLIMARCGTSMACATDTVTTQVGEPTAVVLGIATIVVAAPVAAAAAPSAVAYAPLVLDTLAGDAVGGGSVLPGAAGLGAAAADLAKEALAAQRAGEVHSVLDPIAQERRTTAVLNTSHGNIVGSGGRDLTPAQRATLRPGETAARQQGTHAEQTVLNHATSTGAKPQAIVATRPFCDECRGKIEDSGGRITSPTTAIWDPPPPPPDRKPW